MPQRHLDAALVAALVAQLRPYPPRERKRAAVESGAPERERRAAVRQLLLEEGRPPSPAPPSAAPTAPPVTRMEAPPSAPPAVALAASDRGVLRTLAAGPLPTRALLASLGVDARTLSRSKRRLVDAGLVRTEGEGPGSRWALTDAGRAAPTAEPEPPAPRGRAMVDAAPGLVEALAALTAQVARLADAIEARHHKAP